MTRSIAIPMTTALLIFYSMTFYGLPETEWMPVLLKRYLNNSLCDLILYVFLSLLIYWIFQLVGLRVDRYQNGIPPSEGSASKPRFYKIACVVSGRPVINPESGERNHTQEGFLLRIRETVMPLNFGIWVMPILGFIGTVIGITRAIGGLEPLMKSSMMNGSANLGGAVSGVMSGLKFAFDTTLIGLVLVIPTTLMTLTLSAALSRMEASYSRINGSKCDCPQDGSPNEQKSHEDG